MLKKSLMKPLPVLIAICLFANASTSFGQDSALKPSNAQKKTVSVDEDFLKAAQKAIAERDLFKAESEAKTEQIAAKDAQIAALKGLLQVQESISQSWEKAATARKNAITIDDSIMKKYEDDLTRVRGERDAARRSQKVWGAIGLIFGAVLGWSAKK